MGSTFAATTITQYLTPKKINRFIQPYSNPFTYSYRNPKSSQWSGSSHQHQHQTILSIYISPHSHSTHTHQDSCPYQPHYPDSNRFYPPARPGTQPGARSFGRLSGSHRYNSFRLAWKPHKTLSCVHYLFRPGPSSTNFCSC